MVRSGIDVTGLTVAEAIAAAGRADTSVNPTVADMLLIDPSNPPDEDD